MASRNQAEWVAPALLIVAALVFGLVIWGVYAATRSDEAEDASLAQQLEAYTACLSDEGANVPVIETRGDGGFAVIVPGALLEGDIEFERFAEARQACRHLEPNLLGRLFAGGFELDRRGPGGELFGRGDAPFRDIRELCERLRHGEIEDFDIPAQVAEICQNLGG